MASDDSEDGIITPEVTAEPPRADPPKTQHLASAEYPLLLRLLFSGDGTQAARSAQQLAGRDGQLRTGHHCPKLLPVLRGQCDPVPGPFGPSAADGLRLRPPSTKGGRRAAIGFRSRGPSPEGVARPRDELGASLRLGDQWTLCCWLRLPLPEPRRDCVRTLAMGQAADGSPVAHVQLESARGALTLGVRSTRRAFQTDRPPSPCPTQLGGAPPRAPPQTCETIA